MQVLREARSIPPALLPENCSPLRASECLRARFPRKLEVIAYACIHAYVLSRLAS